MSFPLRALRHRNFALFMGGQMFALVGYWMQAVALSWLLYRLTDSPMMLGVLGFAGSAPVLLLSPLAGMWSDRFNLHRMMFTIQVLEGLQAVTLAALALSGMIEPWHIVTLSALLGVLIAIELPVRHAYLLELVEDRADLPNAVAVTSMVANCGRLAGPAVAGILIGLYGEALCFVINTLTYAGVILTLALIRVTPSTRPASHPTMLQGLAEGLRYAWNSIPIRLLLGLLVLMGTLAAPYFSMMPALVHEVFGGDARAMGFLTGAAGLGALCGTVYLATRSDLRGLVPLACGASLAAGAALALLSWAPSVWAALPLLAVIGFGLLTTSVSINMVLQTIVDDDKRGRVMSFYTAAFLGMAPFGSLAAGALANVVGVAATLTAGGIACTLGAVYLVRRLPLLHDHIAPIYTRLGKKYV